MTREEKELVSTLKISLIRGITFANEENILELVKKCMQEPKTGHWIETDGKDGAFFICDKCHRQSDIKENFCPNCGAKMEG